jgi:2-polyprenyl-3-methyl-5-hydroxy-6-metoxy-1,4-benzoquinol methylase
MTGVAAPGRGRGPSAWWSRRRRAARTRSAGQQALGLFDGAERGTRLHTRLRWWSCPFRRIEAEVPAKGDVLEVGCGHGLLSLYLGLAESGRRVRGVDIDGDKIFEATAAANRLAGGSPNVDFERVDAGFTPSEPCDAVVISDVLYLLTAAEQQRLVTAAARCVRPDGVVVLKEMGLHPRWKLGWNQVQETLATRVLRITDHVGAGLTFVDPETMADWLVAEGLDVRHFPVDRGYPWPHHLVVAHRAVDHRRPEPPSP